MSVNPIPVPATSYIARIAIKFAAAGSYKIGTTEGGDDIVPETSVAAGELSQPPVARVLSMDEDKTLYFTGVTEGVDLYRVIVI